MLLRRKIDKLFSYTDHHLHEVKSAINECKKLLFHFFYRKKLLIEQVKDAKYDNSTRHNFIIKKEVKCLRFWFIFFWL